MILEIATMSITAGSETAFTEAHAGESGGLGQVEGLLSSKLTQGVEDPTQFVLLAEWSDLAAHERFRETEEYLKWRTAIAPFVAGPAEIKHVVVVA
jgi:heme-degrading monooxygenase HmoA